MRIPRPNAIVGARGLVQQERGFALPSVMLMLLAAFAVVSIGVVASIEAQSGSVRDQQTKTALTAAEAGVSHALLLYNAYQYSGFNPASPQCLAGGPPSNGWCQPVTGSDGAGTYSYQVCLASSTNTCNRSPALAVGTLEIASVGTASGITRRVDVTAKSASGTQIFFDAGVKSQTDILFDSNATIHSTTSAGGDISLASNAQQCGAATVGIGHALTLTGNTGYYSGYSAAGCTGPLDPSTAGQQALTLPPVNQGDAATNNDDGRITNALSNASPQPTPKDLISGNKADVTWSAATRQLTIDNNSSLTLTGSTYSLCKLTLNKNSAIYVASGQSVKIFFDSPEACNLPYDDPANRAAGSTQMKLSSNSRISPASGTPASIGLYFVGSKTWLTNIFMSSNTDISGACVQNFVIYAPYTHVELLSNTNYCGAMAGQSIHLNSNAHFITDAASQAILLPATAPHYITNKFVECTAAGASPPNDGC